jgi:hypothetical protein
MHGWVHRAHDLGIIDEGHHNTLCRTFVTRGWKKQEPVAYQGSEEPTRLEQLVFHALAEGIITEAHAAHLCPWYSLEAMEAEQAVERGLSAKALMALPLDERARLLAAAAVGADRLYRDNPDLTGFDAFGEEDLYDYSGQG